MSLSSSVTSYQLPVISYQSPVSPPSPPSPPSPHTPRHSSITSKSDSSRDNTIDSGR
ncbi:hypothetical protein CWATWH0003_3621 [Crocosphaera watsonii WH 0003]|uniref:Uncharacterized protein n=1 Tax=Crocosphaera watsonii WH 0003 TaxID=423471 RepID=G5J837_CROWT|nr:hypothetical protein CWATWH0003_3621 [Crocosphaera watsonii WH 0003]